MTDDQLASGGKQLVDSRHPSSAGVSFEPPLTIHCEDIHERHLRLASLVGEVVIPRLLALNSNVISEAKAIAHPGEPEIARLSWLVVGPDNSDALDYLLSLRELGLSLDKLHVELLEPTARYLGELWDADKVDFVDVTIGLNRLQRLVHHFARLDDVMPYDDKRRALIVTAPGEQHILGNTIVQRFLRAAGWYVCNVQGLEVDDLRGLVANEWFGVVGISVSTEQQIGGLSDLVVAIREASLNKHVGVMVGGPVFTHSPERALEFGADGTAVNAPAAVLLAKKLLVRSISSEG